MLLSLRWAVELSGLAFSFLLKTDDDAFVCTGALLQWLHSWQSWRGSALRSRRWEVQRWAPRIWRELAGSVEGDARSTGLYAGARLPQRCIGGDLVPLFNSTLGEAYRDARCERGWRFPVSTMAGAGYVLSRNLAERAVRNARRLQPTPSAEDATISLLLHWRQEPAAESARGDSGPPTHSDSHAGRLTAHVPAANVHQRGGGGGSTTSGGEGAAEARAGAGRHWASELPFDIAKLPVVPFANRRNGHAITEALAPAAEQLRLVERRCANPKTLVLHKLDPEMIIACGRQKDNQSCMSLRSDVAGAPYRMSSPNRRELSRWTAAAADPPPVGLNHSG